MNKRLDKKQIEVATLQKQYLDSLRSKQAQLEIQRKAEQEATEDGIFDKIKNSITNLEESMKASLKESAVLVESKLSECGAHRLRLVTLRRYAQIFAEQRFVVGVCAMLYHLLCAAHRTFAS